MIAQYRDRRIAEALDEAQGAPRFRTAVHEIAGQPELVFPRIETNLVEKPAKRVITALQVADRVLSQLSTPQIRPGQCSTPGTASVNGGIGASKSAPSSASML